MTLDCTKPCRIAILGTGRMGTSLFDLFSGQGHDVAWVSRTSQRAHELNTRWHKQVARSMRYGLLSAEQGEERKERVFATDDIRRISDADLIIETVIEDLSAKRTVLSQVAEHAKKSAVIASNSSSLLPNELVIEGVDASRLLGLHFFFPISVNGIVEVVTHDRLSPAVCSDVEGFLQRNGFFCIRQGLHNAFIINMLSMAVGGEAFRLSEQFGFKTANELARSPIFPLGPFELFDQVGIPVIREATKRYFARNPLCNKESYADLLRFMELEAASEREDSRFLSGHLPAPNDIPGWTFTNPMPKGDEEELRTRLLYLHINTCFFAVQEKLIGADALESSITAIMGTAKGPFAMAQEIGYGVLKNKLGQYYRETDRAYYRPSYLFEQ